MARLSFEAFPRALDASGVPASGAKLYVYEAGTTTPVTVYSDPLLTTAHASPIVADAEGFFPAIYASGASLKVRLTDADDVLISEVDGIAQDSGAVQFATRAALVTAVASTSLAWGDGTIVSDGKVQYVVSDGATAIGDMPDLLPHGAVTPYHWKTNTTPGTTDMQSAVQAALAYMLDSTVTSDADVFDGARAGTLDLMGEVVAIGSPVVIGDVNGTGAGFGYGLTITNGTLVALSGSWSDLESDVPGYMLVIADWKDADQSDDTTRLHSVILDASLTLNCAYQTGGVFWENTRGCRAYGDVLNVGVECWGHKTSVGAAADNARGVLTKNTELEFHGEVSSGDGAFGLSSPLSITGICTLQTPDGSNDLSLDGGEISGSSWTSPTGNPEIIEVRSSTPYDDGDGTVDVTITGTSDGSTSQSETITLRRNSTQFQATYTTNKFQTVTAVSTNGNHNGQLAVGGSMQNGGFDLRTADIFMSNVVASQMTFAAKILGNGAVQGVNCHFWSREVIIGPINFWTKFANTFFDYTDCRVDPAGNGLIQLNGVNLSAGDTRVVLVASTASETGVGVTVGPFLTGVSRTRNIVDLETTGSGTWVVADAQKWRQPLLGEGSEGDLDITAGRATFGRTSADVSDSGSGHIFYPTGNYTSLKDGTASTEHISFLNDAENTPVQVGSITTSGSATAYNTSSDYRLKKNVEPLEGALEAIMQMRPVAHDWISDGTPDIGFLAHELQQVLPQAVHGEKDGPAMQQVDYAKVVPLLTAAIQEIIRRQQ